MRRLDPDEATTGRREPDATGRVSSKREIDEFARDGGLLEGVLFEVLQVSIFDAGFVAALVTAAGMLSILYALYAPNP